MIGTEAEAVLKIEETTDVTHPTTVEKADRGKLFSLGWGGLTSPLIISLTVFVTYLYE